MEDSKVKKDIDSILKLKKPRSIFSLIKMIYTLSKNFALSLNAIVILIVALIIKKFVLW